MAMTRATRGLIVMVACCVTLSGQLKAQSDSGNLSHRRKQPRAVQITQLPHPIQPASNTQEVSSRRVLNARSAGLRIDDATKFKFVDPEKLLKTKSLKFADANKFINSSSDRPFSKATTTIEPADSGLATGITSLRPRQEDLGLKNVKLTDQASETDGQHLSVSDVYDPINLSPFGDIRQIDRAGLITTGTRNQEPAVVANTYADFTGQYFQPHFSNWSAPNFRHRPLYFEEVNLERYGNELRFQNVVSAAHFFSSAALLPYKWGQTPCRCCITTLGYRRPGDCVPYQIQHTPPSAKGLIYQGLITTALSL